MKKLILFLMTCFLFGFLIGWNLDILECDLKEKDFQIYQSDIFSNRDFKRTYLKVIVYDVVDDIEILYLEIKSFHERMNGLSDELIIELYDSKESLLNGEFISEHTYIR